MKPALTPPHRAPQNTPAFLLLTAFLLAAPPLAAQLSSLESIWHCDGDLTESRTASPLVANGFTPAYQVETIPGGAATVLDLPALDSGLSQSLALPNPSGPNGSGAPTRTNNWTLVMDIRIGALSNDAALLQTDPANADDAEIRVAGGASAGALVFGADPISDPDTIRPATWYRLALTCDGEGPELQCTAYVNGTQTTLGGSPATLTKTHDGRFALQDTALLCSDDTSETQPVRINCVALWDTALTAAEVAALGGPAAPGLPDLFVSNTANSGPGSLRQSIIGLPSGRILSFDLALDAQSIEVDAGGPLAISAKTVTIDALHLSGGLTIDANLNGHRIFEVVSGSELTLRGASLANGIANDLNDDSGGAILNEGTLTVDRCTIEGCHADFSGGAISNNGTLTLCDSTLNSNTAGSGGAVLNSGAAEIKRCTFAGNSGDAAGAIENISSLILTNSTLTGNSATSGGGGAIQTLGSLTVINCTIIGNHSNDPFSGGGGIFRDFFSVTTLENSIVALNTSSVPGEENLGGLFYDQFNETGVNITSGDPLLKSLANYGGPTETMPPDDGSPAKGTGLVIEANRPARRTALPDPRRPDRHRRRRGRLVPARRSPLRRLGFTKPPRRPGHRIQRRFRRRRRPQRSRIRFRPRSPEPRPPPAPDRLPHVPRRHGPRRPRHPHALQPLRHRPRLHRRGIHRLPRLVPRNLPLHRRNRNRIPQPLRTRHLRRSHRRNNLRHGIDPGRAQHLLAGAPRSRPQPVAKQRSRPGKEA